MRSHDSALILGWTDRLAIRPLGCELSSIGGSNIRLKKSTRTELDKALLAGDVSIASLTPLKLFSEETHEVAAPVGLIYSGRSPDFFFGSPLAEQDYVSLNERLIELKAVFKHSQVVFGNDVAMRCKYIVEAARDIKRLPVDKIPTFDLNSAHPSAKAFAKVIYYLCYGEEAYQMYFESGGSSVQNADYRLCTGNKALTMRPRYNSKSDLAAIWEMLTGLPFVAEVFQVSRHRISSSWGDTLFSGAKMASKRISVDPAEYLPDSCPLTEQGNEIELSKLWDSISYAIGPLEFSSMKMFLNLYNCCFHKLCEFEGSIVRMNRWSELTQNTSIQ